MKSVRHTITCAAATASPPCQASIELRISGDHDLRSVSQMLEDVARVAGWNFPLQTCPQHSGPARPYCDCDQRNGIKHGLDCRLVKRST